MSVPSRMCRGETWLFAAAGLIAWGFPLECFALSWFLLRGLQRSREFCVKLRRYLLPKILQPGPPAVFHGLAAAGAPVKPLFCSGYCHIKQPLSLTHLFLLLLFLQSIIVLSFLCRSAKEDGTRPAARAPHRSCVGVGQKTTGNSGPAPWMVEYSHPMFRVQEGSPFC